ncbi:MAG: fumarylacetoacetate hydrolase family protein [Chloroflexi bacterium]|nr:fumarylacetoacetate hydrolase family protein [Chloroflexota bacterium]
MRLVQYDNGGQVGVGVQVDETVFYTGYHEMLSFITDGDRALERAAAAIKAGRPVQFDRLIAPITNPGKIFGSGPNYLSHGQEDPDWEPADEPMWDFIKLTSAITGPYDDIVIPPTDDVIKRGPDSKAKYAAEHGFAVDYEVELGVVIGKSARNVRREDAYDHVFGYTIINDAGSRSVQFHFNQRDMGKNFDTFSPMGPCIVTRDEIPDITKLRIESFVNGERRQSALISDQLNLPDVSIEWISSVIRLEAGDVLSTGTPAGCGTFMKPEQFLKPGDVVRCTADHIGYIENRVVAGTARTR